MAMNCLIHKSKLPTLFLEEDLYFKLLGSPEYANYLCFNPEKQCFLLDVAGLQKNNYYLPVCDDYVAGFLLVDKVNDVLEKHSNVNWIAIKMKRKNFLKNKGERHES